MSIVLFANVHDGPGPIVSDHTVESDHVIHGAYGLTDVDAAGPVHVTFTWAQAAPYELAVAFTNPRTGHHIAWSVARELLRTGGGEGNVHVQRGTRAWVSVSRLAGYARFGVETAWLDELLAATDAIVAPEAEWDNLRWLPSEQRPGDIRP